MAQSKTKSKTKTLPKHRWSRDDAILALDLFLRLADASPSKSKIATESIFFVEPEEVVADDKAIHKVSEIEKAASYIGCTSAEVQNKLAEYGALQERGGVAGKQLQDIMIKNPLRISAMARLVWKEFGKSLGQGTVKPRYDEKLLRDAVRHIIRWRDKPKKIPRRDVRCAAMRVLYAAQTQQQTAKQAWQQLRDDDSSVRARAVFDDALLARIIEAFDADSDTMIANFSAAAERNVERISMVERATIFAAMAEFGTKATESRRVIINEAVEIAKQFGAEGGHKIVNAILDAALPQKANAKSTKGVNN